MRYVGLDVHKRVIEAAFVDEEGKVVGRSRFPCTREAIEAFCRSQLEADDRMALEATTHCWQLVELLEPHAADVVVSNPMRTRAIAEAKVKTDRVDAEVLAQLLRCGYLPTVWKPDANTRAARHLTNRRAGLVSDRTRIKNRIHAVLHQRLVVVEGDLFSKKGLEWLRELELDRYGRAAVTSELSLLAAVETELAVLDQELAQIAHEREQAKLLMTMPGVDYTVAVSLLAALGDINRFPDADRAASYLGLVPSTRQSANHCYHGPITKQGRSHARWMMVQAAQHVGRHPGPLGVFFRRLMKKKNRNVAVVATARKLVTIAYHMLKKNEPYRYAVPRSTQTKLQKLRVKATGKRRKGGNPKGQGRHPQYGKGRTRAIPAIDRVLREERVPAPLPLSDGEKRTVARAGVTDFVRELHEEHRVPAGRNRSSNEGEGTNDQTRVP